MSEAPKFLFTIIPNELILYDLTLRELKVLIALFSFRNKDTNLCYPSRKKLAERTGFSQNRISEISTDLQKKGFIKKTGNGGRSSPTHYQITLPKPGSETLPNSGSETLPKPGRGKELINKQIKELIEGIKELIEWKTQKKFIAPSLEQIKSYANEKKLTGVIPEAFQDFYLAKDWMVGKNKMKDWKAAVRNWNRNQGKFNGTKTDQDALNEAWASTDF